MARFYTFKIGVLATDNSNQSEVKQYILVQSPQKSDETVFLKSN